MEQHVRKQQANVATESENKKKPESEKLPPDVSPTEKEIDNVHSIGDIIKAIKAGDSEFVKVAGDIGQKFKAIVDNMSDIQSRIANIEIFMEAQQLSNVTILDKLAKIAMSFVTFVAKFGTKKDVDEATDGAEAREDGS